MCIEEVYSEVETCCKALSERLDSSPYFFGSKPTELGKARRHNTLLGYGSLYSLIVKLHLSDLQIDRFR
jgi:metaxin